MGLLDFLFGRQKYDRLQIEPFKIWASLEEKYDGIVRDFAARAAAGAEVLLVVAHFDDVLRLLRDRIPDVPHQVQVRLLLSSDLTPELVRELRLDETTSLDILVAERHPLLSADESLAQQADAFPCRSRLWGYVSMEDPLLRQFGGDQMREMMSHLGLEFGEPIRSKMLSRRIEAAQKRVEKEAYGRVPASSAEEWLEINYR